MFRTILLISFLLLPTAASGTTVLLLKDSGTLEGELLNPNEISRKSYRIQTAGGLEISLDAKLVERVQGRERPALIEYNAGVHLTENTVENHLHWARWCAENQLSDQARLHWQQILEIDPDHTVARWTLGYTKEREGWVSQQEKRENRGFVLHKGRWRTEYEIEVETILETQKDTERQWRTTIRDLCRRLPSSEAQLLAIRDPAAITPLRDTLLDGPSPPVRMVLLRSLIRIPHDHAVQFVVGWSIRPDEPLEEIRQMCVDELLWISNENGRIRRMMIDSYRAILRPEVQPAIIDLAVRVLEGIRAHEAVPELIDVLVVTRQETFLESPPAYSMGQGRIGLGQGTKTIRRQTPSQNPSVLRALITLTGMNFQFDKAAWQEWYRNTQRSPAVNLRRS